MAEDRRQEGREGLSKKLIGKELIADSSKARRLGSRRSE
jgi:hypothetical protein